MSTQYFTQGINYATDSASVSSRTLNATQQGATDTAVLRFASITTSSADHFTETTTAAAGTVITILQPGVYIASMNLSIAAAAVAIGVSVGATGAPFDTTPVATGTADGLITLGIDAAATAGVTMCSVAFRVASVDMDGTANLVRFMATVGGAFVATQASMRIDRASAS